jgi:hypothetical protein
VGGGGGVYLEDNNNSNFLKTLGEKVGGLINNFGLVSCVKPHIIYANRNGFVDAMQCIVCMISMFLNCQHKKQVT